MRRDPTRFRLLVRKNALRGAIVSMLAGLFGAVLLARYLRMTDEQALTQIIVTEVVTLLGFAIVVSTTRETTQAVIAVAGTERGREDALSAWSTVAAYPRLVAWRGLQVASVIIFVLGVFAVVNVHAPAWAVVPVVASGELAAIGSMALMLSAFELTTRRVLADVAAELPTSFEPPPGSPSVRTKALAALPIFTLGAAMVVGAFPVESGSGPVRLTIVIAIALVAVAFVSVMFLVVTRSVLDPIGELTAATRRVKAGDLTTAVPVVTADELGTLSASFNQMLDGLREREALRDELLRRQEELRASRARIVAASDAERRRVERNIHDGAQQQLVALAVKLRLLEERAGDDEALRQSLAELGERLKAALSDLRELARGLHPSVLTTDGLAPAIEQLASRAPVPVTIAAEDERYPIPIESTAYFVASEALANVAKYARGSHAEVSVERRDGCLVVRVADDGIGGAHTEAGSGLTGLVDRVAAVGGHLTLDSPPGAGTSLTAELPLS